MAATIHPLASLVVAFLVGAGSVVYVIGRLDRSGESGCFYTLLIGLFAVMALVILMGA